MRFPDYGESIQLVPTPSLWPFERFNQRDEKVCSNEMVWNPQLFACFQCSVPDIQGLIVSGREQLNHPGAFITSVVPPPYCSRDESIIAPYLGKKHELLGNGSEAFLGELRGDSNI